MNQADMSSISLEQFINTNESKIKSEKGLIEIFKKLDIASRKISKEVNRAGLVGILGKANKENIQGEEVMKLDELANDWVIDSLKSSPFCAGVASEELDTFTAFPQAVNDEAQYIVLFDPLDGSSNIDNCATIGTIFGIYRRVSKGELLMDDFLQKGTSILGAGYVIYGSSTIMVYSLGKGVHGFTLEQAKDEYYLSHEDIKTPQVANQFSINNGNKLSYTNHVNHFVDWCCEEDASTNRPYSLRYIGSFVADFHRNLIKGGIFIYPATRKSPHGKLRLTYECIPLSYIQEQAGGLSSNDSSSVLMVEPEGLHQRTPISLGSKELVTKYLSFI